MSSAGSTFGHEDRVAYASSATNVPAPPLYGYEKHTDQSVGHLSDLSVVLTLGPKVGWDIFSVELSTTLLTVPR